MTPKQIETAFGQRLVTVSGLPTVYWPNHGTTPPSRPYIEVAHVPVTRSDRTINGAEEIATGFFLVTIVTEIGIFANSAYDLAADIMAVFAMGWRQDVSGAGAILTQRPPEDAPAFRDGDEWRQPVRVHYTTEV